MQKPLGTALQQQEQIEIINSRCWYLLAYLYGPGLTKDDDGPMQIATIVPSERQKPQSETDGKNVVINQNHYYI